MINSGPRISAKRRDDLRGSIPCQFGTGLIGINVRSSIGGIGISENNPIIYKYYKQCNDENIREKSGNVRHIFRPRICCEYMTDGLDIANRLEIFFETNNRQAISQQTEFQHVIRVCVCRMISMDNTQCMHACVRFDQIKMFSFRSVLFSRQTT